MYNNISNVSWQRKQCLIKAEVSNMKEMKKCNGAMKCNISNCQSIQSAVINEMKCLINIS